MDFKWEIQLVWELDMQQEHLAVAQRAYELFETRAVNMVTTGKIGFEWNQRLNLLE